MKDILLDLETMGPSPHAAIIAIGAVAFNPEMGVLGDWFYEVVDLGSSVAQGGQMEPATVLWWLRQSDEARAAFELEGSKIEVALLKFSAWVRAIADNDARIWGNGANFDNVVLASAYDRTAITRPWSFWNDRCYRTVKALHPEIKMERAGTHHNALDDARSQALHLMEMLRKPVVRA